MAHRPCLGVRTCGIASDPQSARWAWHGLWQRSSDYLLTGEATNAKGLLYQSAQERNRVGMFRIACTHKNTLESVC